MKNLFLAFGVLVASVGALATTVTTVHAQAQTAYSQAVNTMVGNAAAGKLAGVREQTQVALQNTAFRADVVAGVMSQVQSLGANATLTQVTNTVTVALGNQLSMDMKKASARLAISTAFTAAYNAHISDAAVTQATDIVSKAAQTSFVATQNQACGGNVSTAFTSDIVYSDTTNTAEIASFLTSASGDLERIVAQAPNAFRADASKGYRGFLSTSASEGLATVADINGGGLGVMTVFADLAADGTMTYKDSNGNQVTVTANSIDEAWGKATMVVLPQLLMTNAPGSFTIESARELGLKICNDCATSDTLPVGANPAVACKIAA